MVKNRAAVSDGYADRGGIPLYYLAETTRTARFNAFMFGCAFNIVYNKCIYIYTN